MTVRYAPAQLSSLVSIAAALGVLGILNSVAESLVPLAVLTLGLASVGIGGFARRRDYPLVGGVCVLVGAAFVPAALGLLLTTGSERALVMFLPGMLGAFVLSLGVFPIRGSGSRSAVKIGTAGVFFSVLLAGIYEASLFVILLTGIGTILAWDAGDHAISLGTQMGVEAATLPVEVTHIAGSAVVGILAVIVAYGISSFHVAEVSLGQLIVLLVALLFLTLALHD